MRSGRCLGPRGQGDLGEVDPAGRGGMGTAPVGRVEMGEAAAGAGDGEVTEGAE